MHNRQSEGASERERQRKRGKEREIEDENSEHNHNNRPTNIMYRVVEQRTNAITLLFQHSINIRKIHLIASTVFRAGSLSLCSCSLVRIFFLLSSPMRAPQKQTIKSNISISTDSFEPHTSPSVYVCLLYLCANMFHRPVQPMLLTIIKIGHNCCRRHRRQ